MSEHDRQIAACIDMGTTRTRVWLMQDGAVLAKAEGDFGARNGAREGSAALRARLVALLRGVDGPAPAVAVAAGMITSASGVFEVPHVVGPASVQDLQDNVAHTELDGLPLLLVPGIRSASLADAGADIMRGEETLCAGLLQGGELAANVWLLTLGSHWKWMHVDAAGRIAGGGTSLGGELLHVVGENTLLAASLPQRRPESFDLHWLRLGMAEAEASGLGRAFFRVRLLHLAGDTTETQRQSFLYGALLAGELHAAEQRCRQQPGPVLVSGPQPVAEVWQTLLAERGITASLLPEATREQRYLEGLLRLTGV